MEGQELLSYLECERWNWSSEAGLRYLYMTEACGPSLGYLYYYGQALCVPRHSHVLVHNL
jgi:hypothetical protein